MVIDIEDVPKLHKVLNVGGNSKQIAIPECYAGWQHDLLDIDPRGNPDLCCDARELFKTPARVYDSVYCSHNLEHFFWHEVPLVLKGFRIVLKKNGFACIRVPDLRAVMKEVVEGGFDIQDILYTSASGPIRVHDVIYGYGIEIERSGNGFFAHKSGFSEKSLNNVLVENGFPYVFISKEFLEIRAIAFQQEPTNYQKKMLKLV